MAHKARLFSTAAITAMRDTELSGQDWRVYLWVSLHDGMSLLKGKGAGCFTSNLKLAEAVQCDYSSLCRSLSKLVERGHLVREKLGKATTYRVTFPTADNLQDCNISEGKSAPMTCKAATSDAAIACNDFSEPRRNQPKMEEHYSPLSGETIFCETGKIDSAKQRAARFHDYAGEDADDPTSPLFAPVAAAWQDGVQTDRSAPTETEAEILTDAGWGRSVGQSLAQYERLLKSKAHIMDLMEGQAHLARLLDEWGDDLAIKGQIERLYELTWEKHSELQRHGNGGASRTGNWAGR